MNMNDVYNEYCEVGKRNQELRAAWCEKKKADASFSEPYPTFDYHYFQGKIGDALRAEFNLTDKQVGHIMGEAYDRYHSSFGDMFWGAHGLAEFVTKFPKE